MIVIGRDVDHSGPMAAAKSWLRQIWSPEGAPLHVSLASQNHFANQLFRTGYALSILDDLRRGYLQLLHSQPVATILNSPLSARNLLYLQARATTYARLTQPISKAWVNLISILRSPAKNQTQNTTMNSPHSSTKVSRWCNNGLLGASN